MSTSPAVRSPAYPSLSLQDAIDAVAKIESQYRTAPVDREVAAKVLGYSGLTGASNTTLAALAHYGLVERAGKGHMRVTPRARAILHAQNAAEKVENLRAAGFQPDVFCELQERFPGLIPPEDGVVTHLNRQGFNQSAVRPAAKAYLSTLAYLQEMGASGSHGHRVLDDAESGASKGGEGITYGEARVGDLVDYELNGAIANPEPMRVRALSDDGKWVFVDGSETGLEMDNVIVKDRPAEPEKALQRPTLPLPKKDQAEQAPQGMRKAMFPLSEGDVTLIFPEAISADGLGDLADYLEIFLKKESRNKEQR